MAWEAIQAKTASPAQTSRWLGGCRPGLRKLIVGCLVVHSLNTEYLHLEGKLLGTPRRLMPAASPPHKGMFMGIPVGRGRLDGLDDLLPGLKTPAFERQRAQDLPPGFDEVEVGRIRRLIDELPARMMDHEQQQVAAMMHLQIVHDGVDALCVFWDLFVHRAEEVDKMHGAAVQVALRPALPCGLPQRPI